MKRIKLSDKFDINNPLLPNVRIIDSWATWDGPIFGICEVHGQKLFFSDTIESIWHVREDRDETKRGHRIYAAYDVDLDEIKEYVITTPRAHWEELLNSTASTVGIFWDYELIR